MGKHVEDFRVTSAGNLRLVSMANFVIAIVGLADHYIYHHIYVLEFTGLLIALGNGFVFLQYRYDYNRAIHRDTEEELKN